MHFFNSVCSPHCLFFFSSSSFFFFHVVLKILCVVAAATTVAGSSLRNTKLMIVANLVPPVAASTENAAFDPKKLITLVDVGSGGSKEKIEKKLAKLRAKRTNKLKRGKDTAKLDGKIADLERQLFWYNKCPIGSNGQVCSGNGSCSKTGFCECYGGWGGKGGQYDCSVPRFVSKFG